ncbi:hypothetical protein CRUP_030564 [Coryphaenoides rupestris]|nr:hypothetical protein CRUP_030564 [Coryphaenoides rupestris]
MDVFQRILGVVIGKTDVRSFPDRKNVGVDRCTFSFTVKDSPEDFINVSAWGPDGFISLLSGGFSIGDCENPLVANKDPEKEEKFCPTTPCPYRLLLSEAHSRVLLWAHTEEAARLLPLLRLPVKDPRDFYSLGDIVANGQGLDGRVLNVLAAVRSIAEPKQFTTSDGRRGQRLEVKLFDDSVTSFSLISFDSFRNCMVATVNSKTIVTVNPDTKEASQLYTYAKEMSVSGALEDDAWLEDMSVDSITDVFTVNHLKLRAQESPEVFFGLTYSFISRLDLDSSISKRPNTNFLSHLSTRCKYQVSQVDQGCSNPSCPGRDQPPGVIAGFDLQVDISDHTGTLHGCSLQSLAAETTLGCTVGGLDCRLSLERSPYRA